MAAWRLLSILIAGEHLDPLEQGTTMMKRFFLLLLAMLAFQKSAQAFSLPEHQDRYAGRCIRAILSCHYDSALHVVDSVIAVDSTDPLAPVIRLAAIGVQDVDFDTLLDSASFFRTYRIAESRIGAYERRLGVSSYSKMVTGFCKAIHSSYFLRLQSYYSALHNGFGALDLLNDAYILDTSNVDALLFPALYNYARGELKKRLWWVLFWYPGSKIEGINRLLLCEKYGCITSSASLFALAEIYTRENNPDEGARIIARLEQEFSQSRFVLWEKAKFLESQRHYFEAALVYELLTASYDAERCGAHGAIVTLNLQAHLLLRAGLKKDAAEICRALLSRTACKRNKVIFKDTKKLLKQINEG
jgi:hypothetical protein